MRSLIQTGAPDLCLLAKSHSWTLKQMLYFCHQKKKENTALSNFAWVSQKESSLYIRLRTTVSLKGPWDSYLFHAVLDSFKINLLITCQKACPRCLGISVCVCADVCYSSRSAYCFKVRPMLLWEYSSPERMGHLRGVLTYLLICKQYFQILIHTASGLVE